MIRPWQVWLAFALGAAVVLGATGWASWTALRLDRAKAEALRKGALEENVRLALWRMDSSLSSLVAQEHGRPYFLYTPFYPAERAYTRMYSRIEPNEVLMPSPLLTFEAAEVKLHFQIGPDKEFSSPQVPTSNMRDLAELGYRTPERIEAASALLKELKRHVKPEELCKLLPASSPAAGVVGQVADLPHNPAQQLGERYRPASQALLSQQEQQNRQGNSLNAAQSNAANPNWYQTSAVGEGVLKPLWLDGELILARRVQANGQTWLQGCWLDWPRIEKNLLAGVSDLLPQARLEPITGAVSADDTRLLASLPVRLHPGALPVEAANGITPVRISLLIAWVALLLAALLVGFVLWQALALSERRGAFVSAVTHELRTPLTTFRLYTELLAEGDRVPAAKRATYLETLRREADRLGHLVENVLAYARLERSRPGGRAENIALGTLLERTRARLADRAAQAGMKLEAALPENAGEAVVRADPGAVEQILFNLVDNACKYAAAAPDKTIRLEGAVDRGAGRAAVVVRDLGPGLRDTRRLFQPFSKPAQEAARTAPGVGLGLALSRRLAREMGGDLACDMRVAEGARFVLTLPLAAT
ncbi:MAG: HAMP domain-containing sensor histidine kinase [Planctomycetota bacterium]|nr:HAMP domain-containing sensor histidine kinase [Planctomycetota bacterium]